MILSLRKGLKTLLAASVLLCSFLYLDAQEFAGGSGTENDPWLIQTAQQLNNVRNYLGIEHSDKFFKQTADINLRTSPWNQNYGWMPIGNRNNYFTGNFDGNSYGIRGLLINRNAVAYQGLFGYLAGAVITNVRLSNVYVIGGRYVGSLAGMADFASTIENCSSTGEVRGNISVGGLVGELRTNSALSHSYSICTIVGRAENIGGLVGSQVNRATISNSYSRSLVYTGNNAGGLVGSLQASSIINCFSSSSIQSNRHTGGLVAAADINSYVINSYWDIDRYTQDQSAGGEGRTTGQMTYPYDENTYSDWDFEESWYFDEFGVINSGYPCLRWQVFIYPYPDRASNPEPHNRAENISIDLEALRWTYSRDILYTYPVGFRIYINSTGIFNEDDDFEWVYYTDNQSNYSFTGISNYLDYNTTYYWQVVPTTIEPERRGSDGEREKRLQLLSDHQIVWQYISFSNCKYQFSGQIRSRISERGDAQNCPVWSFSTVLNPANPVTATNPEPGNGVYNVPFDLSELQWSYIPDTVHVNPAGFRVYFSKDGEFGDDDYVWVNYEENRREYSTAEILPELSYATTYYWLVVPTTIEPERRGSDGEREKRLQLLAALRSRISERGDAVNCPVWVFTTEFEGSGTLEDPWLVETAVHLSNVKMPLDNFMRDVYFLQTADITLPQPDNELCEGWLPVGSHYNYPFIGNYNGNGFVIDSLFINQPDTDYKGLFGNLRFSEISNVRLTNVNITGNSRVGGIAGNASNGVTIKNCSVEGIVFGGSYIGGLVGSADNVTIIDCHTSCNTTGSGYAGGLIGHSSNTDVFNSFTTGIVNGVSHTTGGLIGRNNHLSNVINCYSTATVKGEEAVGGLIGWNTSRGIVSNSYSTGYVSGSTYTGGLIGRFNREGEIKDSYWNIETSNHTRGTGKGKTTSQMLDRETFLNWDFDSVWAQEEGVSYPYHIWQQTSDRHNIPGPFNLTDQIDAGVPAVRLSWELINTPEKINIYRNQEIVQSLDYPVYEWLDTDVTAEERYYYYITALFNENDTYWESLPSNTIKSFVVNHFAGGYGTKMEPWQITTAEQLDNIRHYTGSFHRNKHFIQSADIDLSLFSHNNEDGWIPIGRNNLNNFQGSYDGNGFVIKNLYINRPEESNMGLFGFVSSASIKNLGITGFKIAGSSSSGGLVGWAENQTLISNCYTKGIIEARTAGGLAGAIYSSQVQNCHSIADVTTNYSAGGLLGNSYYSEISESFSSGNVNGRYLSGGLVGQVYSSIIDRCYSTGAVRHGDSFGACGGLVGYIGQSSIINSYSRASATSLSSTPVGGLIGAMDGYQELIKNSYSTGKVTGLSNVGGLIGYSYGNLFIVENCYWDIETSGVTVSAGGEGKMTSMLTYPYHPDVYKDWDFEHIWTDDSDYEMNKGYPFLFKVTDHVDIEMYEQDTVPVRFKVTQYPNPFNPNTIISFTLPSSEQVKIEIFNIKGQRIITLYDDMTDKGHHKVIWNGKDNRNKAVSSGIYFYRIRAGNYVEKQKMTLLR